MKEPWLTVEQAAERMGICRRVAYAEINAGRLRAVQVGTRGRRVPVSAIEEYERARTVKVEAVPMPAPRPVSVAHPGAALLGTDRFEFKRKRA